MSDLEIIKKIIDGERALYKELVLRHQAVLFKFVKAFNLQKEIVEEIAQDVFAQAFFKLNTYDADKSQFTTWLLTIAKNRTLTYLKTKARRKEDLLHEGQDFFDSRSPLQDLENQENEVLIFKALAELPTDFRSVIVLFFINELSLNDIAFIEKCSLGTVKSRLFRAKELMKKYLKAEMENEPQAERKSYL